MLKTARFVLVFIFLIALDQSVKLYFLNFRLNLIALNSGGAFSLGSSINFYQYLAFLVLIVFTAVLIIFKIIQKHPWPVVLIYAGAVSDLIDRVRLGAVADYIDLKIWPSFNLADMFIVAGVFWLALGFLKSSKKD